MCDDRHRVRIGLRIQILLLIGGLLAVALGPLLWAQNTLARLSLERQQQKMAFDLGSAACSAQLAQAPGLGASSRRVTAGVVQRSPAQVVAQFGSEPWLSRIKDLKEVAADGTLVEAAGQRALVVSQQDTRGEARVAVLLDDAGAGLRQLTRLYALYMGLVALLLLVAIYIVLGRVVVRPLETLARAAERVASGSRRWEVPAMPARELALLDGSLSTMTARLLDEEQELRRHFDEVQAATERLKEAQQRLVRSERLASVGRLAAGLAHEIGNPLASLIGFEDLLIAGGLTPAEQSDFLQRMRKETDRIHKVLRDLLDFARPSQTRDNAVQEQPGDVAEAIDDALALVGPQKIMKQVQLIKNVEQALPLVSMPRSELVQVLLNLLLNAADALNGSGTIQLACRTQGKCVRIQVEDNGPGLAESVREQLFEPFVTTKDVGKGTGLGLAVCRGLVEDAGGIIGWDASFVEGTRFVIELPILEDAETLKTRDSGL
jgi:signal transduction histidine kinase